MEVLSLWRAAGRRLACCQALALLLPAPLIAAPAAPPTQHQRIAILADAEAQKLPCVSLLETQLSNRAGIELVEREQLAAILKEQSLSALSGAAACANRLTVGKLLHAEMLILLTRRDPQDKALSVVVSETRQGLRLRVTQLPAAAPPETTADTLGKEFDAALKKSAEKIRLIAAVPPLINKDLTRDRDYLQGSYAHLLQEMLLSLPGVVVVDTEEAKAIGAELALAGSNSITRGLPVYLLGEFRCETRNEQVPPYVKLTLRLGERELGSRQIDRPAAEAIPGFLRKATTELLAAVNMRQAAMPDPLSEAQELLARARQFSLIGTDHEAAALVEASLLLIPEQPEAHRLAMICYARCGKLDKEDKLKTIRDLELAAEHMERYLLQSNLSNMSTESSITVKRDLGEALFGLPYLFNAGEAEAKERRAAYQVRLFEIYHRVLSAKYQAGEWDDGILDIFQGRWLNQLDAIENSLDKVLKLRLDMMPMILSPKVKYPQVFIRNLVEWGIHDGRLRQPIFATYLDTLEKQYPHPDITKAVAKQRTHMQQVLAADAARGGKPQTAPPPTWMNPPAQTGSEDVLLTKLEWKCEGQGFSPADFEMCGILPCSAGVDLVWSIHNNKEIRIYLMREKGQLIRVCAIPGGMNVWQATYDGRYAWVPIMGKAPALVRVDIASGEATTFTPQHGLPPFNTAVATALSPGTICLSGVMDGIRAFVAIASADSAGKLQLKILLEAAHQLDRSLAAGVQAQDLQFTFTPRFMLTQTGADGHQYVVIGRSHPDGAGTSLLINISTGQMQVMKAGSEGHLTFKDVKITADGAFWASYGGIRRLGMDSTDNVPIRADLPPHAKLAFWDGRVHAVFDDWFVAERLGEPFRKVKATLPYTANGGFHSHLDYSNHYGLVFIAPNGVFWAAFQVTFPGLPAK